MSFQRQLTKTTTSCDNDPGNGRESVNRAAAHVDIHRVLGNTVQNKLKISRPGDECEREADRMADRVMQTSAPMSVSPLSLSSPSIQRACAGCDQAGQWKDEEPVIRRKQSAGVSESHRKSFAGALKESGRSLELSTRTFMESRFNTDFSDVRIHAGADAAVQARALNARAFTLGRDIYFDTDQYAPESSSGRRLLAHELTHVLQQERSPSITPMLMRQAYTGCDEATTGIADSDKKVGAAHERAVDLVLDARVKLGSPDNATLAMLDRHFHCPSTEVIKTVIAKFEKISSRLLSISPSCVTATDEKCQQGRDFGVDAMSGYLDYLRFCPSMFASEDSEAGMTRAFINVGARLSGLSPDCAITDPCYGDAAVDAASMAGNIDSYVAFAFELSGHTFAPVPTVTCGGDRDERWRRTRRELAGPSTDDQYCTYNACGDRSEDVRDDLKRAIEGTDKAIGVLAGELDEATARAFDWYFSDTGKATVATVRERLGCIRAALQDTIDNDRFGCTRRKGAYAFVVGSGPLCEDTFARICLDKSYFGISDRSRVATLIHECGHRVGLSTHSSGMDDVYAHSPRFLNMRTSGALLNTDSYAHFVNAVVNGVPATLLPELLGLGVGYGRTSEGGNYFRFAPGIELQHPSLLFFNPTLGLAFTALSQPTEDNVSVKPGADMLVSLLGGVRIADPRPGAHGGAYLDLRGGPALAFDIDSGAPDTVGFGAEASATVGWRWRWLDVGVSGGVLHDSLRDEGERTVYYGGVKISILPIIRYFPGID